MGEERGGGKKMEYLRVYTRQAKEVLEELERTGFIG